MRLADYLRGKIDQPDDEEEPLPEDFSKIFHVWKRDLWNLLLLNLIFFVTSLLVVTVPLAVTGMTSVLDKMLHGKHAKVWGDYWETIKKRWKQSLVVGFFFIAVVILGVVGTWFYVNTALPMRLPLSGLCLAAALFGGGILPYAMTLVAVTDLSSKKCISIAARLSVIRLPATLAAFIIEIGLIAVIGFVILEQNWFIVLIPAITFVLVGMVGTYFAGNAVDQYVRHADDDD